ncbi:MAG: hypothetical protein FGM61_04575 [Sediminibacterium sp.]|nr:hypothetical protein [Sediminibacterium sp.]
MKNRRLISFCLHLTSIFGVFHSFAANHFTDSTLEKSSVNAPRISATQKKLTTLKPTGDFDQRFEHIGNQSVSVWGYRLGVLVNDRYKVGLGGYFYNQLEAAGAIDKNGLSELAIKKHASFGTVYFEPYLLRKKRWEMSVVVEAGWGVVNTDSVLLASEKVTIQHSNQHIFPVGTGLSANLIMPDIRGLHFLTYFGINGMAGIRKTFGQTGSGFYWSISSAIFIDRIFTDIKYGSSKKKPARFL